jgi:hypothetical protein
VDETTAPREPFEMSARNRRRFLIGLAAFIVLMFAGGMVGYLVDYRHHSICAGGAQWVSRTDDGIGAVTYTCPDGKTVTEGLLP